MKLNRIVPLCLLAMLPFRTVAIAQETREEAQKQQREEKQQTVTPYRTESPRARAESRRDRRHPAHHSRWHLREAWEHHDRKRFRVRGGLSLASSLRLRRRPRRVGRRLAQGVLGRRGTRAVSKSWRRPISGGGLRPALRVSTGRLLWSRSGLASVRAGRLSAARSDVWRASGYARGSRRLDRWRPRVLRAPSQ